MRLQRNATAVAAVVDGTSIDSRPEESADTLSTTHTDAEGAVLATVSDSAAKLAVLIDADNAQPAIVGGLLAEVAKYGTAHVKRAYGDWTGPSLKGWKDQLLAQSIQPIQQFAYTNGKNATDAAMIIDAMDLLYTGRFDGFCVVSSDSDFTRLASRIRPDGIRLRRTQGTKRIRSGLRQVRLYREPHVLDRPVRAARCRIRSDAADPCCAAQARHCADQPAA